MSLGAKRTQFTEPSIIVFAWREASLLADMLVQAVVAVRAVPRPRERLAFRHATQVVFM
jgi:hypothetical protein